jgi:hypothetical protein
MSFRKSCVPELENEQQSTGTLICGGPGAIKLGRWSLKK